MFYTYERILQRGWTNGRTEERDVWMECAKGKQTDLTFAFAFGLLTNDALGTRRMTTTTTLSNCTDTFAFCFSRVGCLRTRRRR